MLARLAGFGAHWAGLERKRSPLLRRLWTRLGCLIAVLALAVSAATAAPVHRIIAVGDLHGDFAAWRDIAREARLIDGKGAWTGGDAVLVQTGDVVDRGSDSLKIIQDLMRLQREALRAHGQVIALVGNHEAMNVTGDFRYVSAADYAAFADDRSAQRRENVYAANKQAIEAAYRQRDPNMTDEAIKQAWIDATPLGSLEHQVAWRPDGAIGRWIVTNPAVVLLDGTLFVHGGISPAYTRLPIVEINRQIGAALTAKSAAEQAILNDPLGPLWYRGLADEAAVMSPEESGLTASVAASLPPIETQLETLLSAYDAKRIVIGHTPILSGIAVLYGGRLIRIDTGISSVYNGKVSYLEILDGTPVPHVAERSHK
jgi:calcineurin-like phosphoesterase family protein